MPGNNPPPPPPPPRPAPWYPPERDSYYDSGQYSDEEYEQDPDDFEDTDYTTGRPSANRDPPSRRREHEELPDFDIYGILRGHPMYRPYSRYTGPRGNPFRKAAAELEAKRITGKSEQKPTEKEERPPSPLPLPPWMRPRPAAPRGRMFWDDFYGGAGSAGFFGDFSARAPAARSRPPGPADEEGETTNSESPGEDVDLFEYFFGDGGPVGKEKQPGGQEKGSG